MIKALKREDLFNKVHFAELVPFASTDISSIPEEVYGKSMNWLEKFIGLCKPKMIICSVGVGKRIVNKFSGRHIQTITRNVANMNKDMMSLYELQGSSKGTIIVLVQHFSNSVGVSHSKDYDDDAMRDAINRAWSTAKPLRKIDGALLSQDEVNSIVKDNIRKLADRNDLEDFRSELEQITKREGRSAIDSIISAYTS